MALERPDRCASDLGERTYDEGLGVLLGCRVHGLILDVNQAAGLAWGYMGSFVSANMNVL
jgi:hypothetical protein